MTNIARRYYFWENQLLSYVVFVSKRAGICGSLNAFTESFNMSRYKFSVSIKGIVTLFELKEIDLFYYLIDAGEFSYHNDRHFTTISGLS